jgi:predicted GIY-YIG superfamily endonuclease
MNEVKGLYIFYENNIPIYVGISRTILKRLRHHFLEKKHNEATLVYLMLRHDHDETHGLYFGERAALPNFDMERGVLQEQMRKDWKIAIIPENDNYKMYFSEIYLASCIFSIISISNRFN